MDVTTCELRSMGVQIGPVDVLRDISFSCFSSTVTVVLGRNGSGKSTLLKTVAGLCKPSSGDVLYFSKNVQNYSLLQLAGMRSYVPQEGIAISGYTVENLFETVGCLNPSDVLREVGLSSSYLCKPLHALSGGEKQLVAVCLAMAQQALFWVWDEPCHFLDYHHQERVLHVMKKHASLGGTVLVSLHDLAQAKWVSDMCVWLDEGMLQGWGESKEVCTRGYAEKVYGVCPSWCVL
jgi:iron complex transport system ATP-binding protein